MSQLHVYQSLWATELRIPNVPERSIAARFDQVRDASFDGMSIDLGALTLDQAWAAAPNFKRTGLKALLTAFPQSIEDIRPAIKLAKAIDAPFLIVVGQVMPITVDEMIPVIRAWLAIGAEEGLPLQFETHRDSITNDLFSTLQLLDAVPAMELSADLSHYVVDRELSLPVPAKTQAMFEQVMARAGSFQGRVATGQHIQVPLDFPQHRPWVALFEGWWKSGFASWRARHSPDEDLIFLCELGPTEYAISGADGLELSDRWAEALQLRALAKAAWRLS